jgi:hypothetical protein
MLLLPVLGTVGIIDCCMRDTRTLSRGDSASIREKDKFFQEDFRLLGPVR